MTIQPGNVGQGATRLHTRNSTDVPRASGWIAAFFLFLIFLNAASALDINRQISQYGPKHAGTAPSKLFRDRVLFR